MANETDGENAVHVTYRTRNDQSESKNVLAPIKYSVCSCSSESIAHLEITHLLFDCTENYWLTERREKKKNSLSICLWNHCRVFKRRNVTFKHTIGICWKSNTHWTHPFRLNDSISFSLVDFEYLKKIFSIFTYTPHLNRAINFVFSTDFAIKLGKMDSKKVNWKASILSLLYLLCCACTANGRVAGKVGYNNNYYSGKWSMEQLEWIYEDYKLIFAWFAFYLFGTNSIFFLHDDLLGKTQYFIDSNDSAENARHSVSHSNACFFFYKYKVYALHRSKDFFVAKNTPFRFISLLLHALSTLLSECIIQTLVSISLPLNYRIIF